MLGSWRRAKQDVRKREAAKITVVCTQLAALYTPSLKRGVGQNNRKVLYTCMAVLHGEPMSYPPSPAASCRRGQHAITPFKGGITVSPASTWGILAKPVGILSGSLRSAAPPQSPNASCGLKSHHGPYCTVPSVTSSP